MTIEKAIRELGKQYGIAKTLDYVRNPVAWALYQVWKMADAEDKTMDGGMTNGN